MKGRRRRPSSRSFLRAWVTVAPIIPRNLSSSALIAKPGPRSDSRTGAFHFGPVFRTELQGSIIYLGPSSSSQGGTFNKWGENPRLEGLKEHPFHRFMRACFLFVFMRRYITFLHHCLFTFFGEIDLPFSTWHLTLQIDPTLPKALETLIDWGCFLRTILLCLQYPHDSPVHQGGNELSFRPLLLYRPE